MRLSISCRIAPTYADTRGALLHMSISISKALNLNWNSSSLRTKLSTDWANSKGKLSGQVLSHAFISLKHCIRSLATALFLNSRSKMNVTNMCSLASAIFSCNYGQSFKSCFTALILFSRSYLPRCRTKIVSLSILRTSLAFGSTIL